MVVSKKFSPSTAARGARRWRAALALTGASSAWLGAASCVPAVRYEEARSAAEVEAEAKRRVAAELEKARAENERLRAELSSRRDALDDSANAMQQIQLEQDLANKQRDETASLVEQLRGELARVGAHLQQATEENRRLERELADLRTRAEASERARLALVTDVALAVGAARLERAVRITSEGSAVVVRAKADTLFEPESATPRAALTPLLERLLKPELSAQWSVRVREAEPDPELAPEIGEQRRERIRSALDRHGVGTFVRLERPVAGTPQKYELVFDQVDAAAVASGR